VTNDEGMTNCESQITKGVGDLMKVLVIGGTRYMGRVAVQRLLDRGDSVTVFSRGRTKPEWWEQVESIVGDRDDREGFVKALSGRTFDAVIDTQAFRKEDVEAADRALKGNVGRYLMVSTGSVYGDGKLDFLTHCPFRESDVDWTDLRYDYPEGESEYGVGKRHCEKWLIENSSLEYTIIRIPAAMGWDDPTNRMWWWVQRVLDGKGIMLPEDHRSPFRTLFSEDAADNWIRAIDSPAVANEVFHIATEEVLSPERWIGLMAEAAGVDCPITWVPGRVIEKQADLKGYTPPMTRSWPYIHDLSKAISGFGMKTTPAAVWIERTVAWYRNEYEGKDSSGYEDRVIEVDLATQWSEARNGLIGGF